MSSRSLRTPPAPLFWRVDQPNVRFTRTPKSSMTRRKEEEESRRLAEEEARLKAEEEARRIRETRLAQAQSLHARPLPGEASRVRYARTPNSSPARHEPVETAAAAPAAAPAPTLRPSRTLALSPPWARVSPSAPLLARWPPPRIG